MGAIEPDIELKHGLNLSISERQHLICPFCGLFHDFPRVFAAMGRDKSIDFANEELSTSWG